jgi:hypothetical protein
MNPSDELGQLLRQMSPSVDDTGVWNTIEQRANQRRKNHIRFLVPVATALILLAGASFGIFEAVSHLGPPQPILVIGDDTTVSNVTSIDTLTPEQRAQQWYDSGTYMGFWAGNVETIPEHSADLPDIFFQGPTPSGTVETDDQGNPFTKDPSGIKKPLWVFGDEVRVSDYADQIRQAKADGRAVVFYATSLRDATTALGLEPMDDPGSAIERLTVSWLPWLKKGMGAVHSEVFLKFVGPRKDNIFAVLASNTLRNDQVTYTVTTGGAASGTTTTSGVTPTTATYLSRLWELTWPKQGLQPDAVMERLHSELGANSVPIYLPKGLPPGFYVTTDYVDRLNSKQPSPNPSTWNTSFGERAGWGLSLTNGTSIIRLMVNFAGDSGDVAWRDTGIAFEGGRFKVVDGTSFIGAFGAKNSSVNIVGSSSDESNLAEVLELARGLVRVE